MKRQNNCRLQYTKHDIDILYIYIYYDLSHMYMSTFRHVVDAIDGTRQGHYELRNHATTAEHAGLIYIETAAHQENPDNLTRSHQRRSL